MTIVYRMREEYKSAEVEHCRENTGIRADVKKEIIILKGERLVPEHNAPKMCDCVIFRDDMKVVIAELKYKASIGSSLLEKFHNTGEKLCEMIKPSQPSDFDIYLVLIAKKYATSTIRVCRDNPVRIGGKRYKISTESNNVCLSKIIKS